MKSAADYLSEYLERGKIVQIATSAGEQSWLCHVWYAWDRPSHSIVFMSRQSRRHCMELRANPRVSGGVVAIELEGLGQVVRGVTFEGRATPAAAADLPAWYEVYAKRWPQVRKSVPIDRMSETPEAAWLFVVTLTSSVLFDEENFPAEPRQEVVFGP